MRWEGNSTPPCGNLWHYSENPPRQLIMRRKKDAPGLRLTRKVLLWSLRKLLWRQELTLFITKYSVPAALSVLFSDACLTPFYSGFLSHSAFLYSHILTNSRLNVLSIYCCPRELKCSLPRLIPSVIRRLVPFTIFVYPVLVDEAKTRRLRTQDPWKLPAS